MRALRKLLFIGIVAIGLLLPPQSMATTMPEKAKITQVGKASWYGPRFHGRRTASGEIFNTYDLTAAHKTLPFGTIVEVTDITTNKSVRVRINDRGPYIKGRIIDLSKKAATDLGIKERGVANIIIKVM